jgi:ribosomal protein L40E
MPRMSIGAVLDEAWTLYTRFFTRFFVLALIVFAIVNFAFALFWLALDERTSGGVFLGVLALATAIIGQFWLQGAVVFAVEDARDGVFDASTREIFGRVMPLLGALVVAGILAGLGVGVGLFLLIVPGLFLLTIWSMVAPVIVLERSAVLAAFGRSRALVRGSGFRVFGLILVTIVLTTIAGNILRAVFSFLPLFLEISIGSTVASAVVAPFSAIALTVAYFMLREREEPPVEGAPAAATVVEPAVVAAAAEVAEPPVEAGEAEPAPDTEYVCPRCGATVAREATACSQCGQEFDLGGDDEPRAS